MDNQYNLLFSKMTSILILQYDFLNVLGLFKKARLSKNLDYMVPDYLEYNVCEKE